MFKSRARGAYATGQIVSVDKDKVVISVETDDKVYKKGQLVRATVSATRKTALGRSAKVSEVIAQGTIAEVSGRMITIHSKSSNPIISQKALKAIGKPKTVVNMKSIQ